MFEFSDDQVANLIEAIAIIIALFALVRGVFEYSREQRFKRKERFFQQREKFIKNYFHIIQIIDEYDSEYKELARNKGKVDDTILEELKLQYNERFARIPYKERHELLDLLEEIALMMANKLVDKKLVYYMYGWLVEDIWKHDGFWEFYTDEGKKVSRLAEKETDWEIIKDLVLEMREIGKKYNYRRGIFKF